MAQFRLQGVQGASVALLPGASALSALSALSASSSDSSPWPRVFKRCCSNCYQIHRQHWPTGSFGKHWQASFMLLNLFQPRRSPERELFQINLQWEPWLTAWTSGLDQDLSVSSTQVEGAARCCQAAQALAQTTFWALPWHPPQLLHADAHWNSANLFTPTAKDHHHVCSANCYFTILIYGYGSIPIDTFLVGWTSIYQLFWGSLGTRVLTHPHMFMLQPFS